MSSSRCRGAVVVAVEHAGIVNMSSTPKSVGGCAAPCRGRSALFALDDEAASTGRGKLSGFVRTDRCSTARASRRSTASSSAPASSCRPPWRRCGPSASTSRRESSLRWRGSRSRCASFQLQRGPRGTEPAHASAPPGTCPCQSTGTTSTGWDSSRSWLAEHAARLWPRRRPARMNWNRRAALNAHETFKGLGDPAKVGRPRCQGVDEP